MKYKLSVPVMYGTFERNGKENTVKCLKEIKADRVFYILMSYTTDQEERERFHTRAKESIAYLKSFGFEVGIWITTSIMTNYNPFTCQKNLRGETNAPCFADPDFVDFVKDYLIDLAKLNPNLIMFDDDFRYRHWGGCICHHHLKLLSERLGYPIEEKNVEKIFFNDGCRKNSDIWFDVMSDVMYHFAQETEKAIHSVDKTIRFGFCSVDGSWGIDGTNAIKLSKIMAGETKPFIRLIGAPYWSHGTTKIGSAVEAERKFAAFAIDSGVELITEGDVFPRPRYNCPAGHLECFDQILRAEGTTHGILKYVLDYTSHPEYERGYIDKHLKNQHIYEAIEKHFDGKESVGVRIREFPINIKDLSYLGDFMKRTPDYAHKNPFYSIAGEFLSFFAIPASYTAEDSVEMIFGENAKYVNEDLLNHGAILDITAAKILTARGIDVGLKRILEKEDAMVEIFPEEGLVYTGGDATGGFSPKLNYIKIETKEQAQILSHYQKYLPSKKYEKEQPPKIQPAAYLYENKSGQRFYVLAIDGWDFRACQTYAKGRQLAQAIEYVGKKKMLFKCFNNPYMYSICKKDDNEIAIGLWNTFADRADNVCLEMDKEYEVKEFINVCGKVCGNKIYLEKIYPFEFAGIVLESK